MSRIPVFIADDHPIFRRGLRELVSSDRRFEVVGEAENGLEALAALRSLGPAIGVLDISMPGLDGLEVLAQTRTWPDPPAIVLLTLHGEYVERAFRDGAVGYVLKEHAEEQLLACLDVVAAGGRFVCPGIDWRPVSGGRIEVALPTTPLTATERRILRLLSQFKTSREIAAVLCVSPRTVQNHRANMCAKLGLKGSKALLQFALDHATEI